MFRAGRGRVAVMHWICRSSQASFIWTAVAKTRSVQKQGFVPFTVPVVDVVDGEPDAGEGGGGRRLERVDTERPNAP